MATSKGFLYKDPVQKVQWDHIRQRSLLTFLLLTDSFEKYKKLGDPLVAIVHVYKVCMLVVSGFMAILTSRLD